MLTLFGAKQRFCDGISRRNFLKIGAFGTGLTLTDMLRLKATAGASKTTQKSAIMIFLFGGPSHVDMYDMKPEAPMEFKGEFKPIQTSVPGVQICEHMPLQAQMFDKLACIRSIVSVDEHSDSLVCTGYTENANRVAHHPSFGAVMSKLRASESNGIPPFVSLRNLSAGLEPGYLGVAHRAFTPNGPGLENLRMANGVSASRMDDRKGLLNAFDTVRRDIDASGSMKGLDAFAGRAFDIVASGAVRKALDLNLEDPRTRDRYHGVEDFLRARRLVEAGVGCVTLNITSGHHVAVWDTHEKNFPQMRRLLPQMDRGVANLIQDLHERGMENDVVTVMWGEFGRSPRINKAAGRDHWGPVMSALVAGGGLKMGQAIGTTNARGEYPKDRPYQVPQVLSTLYRAIGIDPSQTFNSGSGRPMYILDEREPVTELL